MNSPNRIALFAASALFLAGFGVSVATRFGGWTFNPASIALAAIEFLLAGALVWVGTYVGARISAPKQRTTRLARVLALLYGTLGVALAIPIKTHAVLVDVPITGSPPISYLTPVTLSIATSLVIVVISLLVARALATVCGDRVGRDA